MYINTKPNFQFQICAVPCFQMMCFQKRRHYFFTGFFHPKILTKTMFTKKFGKIISILKNNI